MLCHVEFVINSTVADSVGDSPFELGYGEQVRLPVDAIVGHWSGRSIAVNFVHVEGRHGVLFTTNCLLLVGKTSPSCLGLSINVSGGFV